MRARSLGKHIKYENVISEIQDCVWAISSIQTFLDLPDTWQAPQ